MFDGDDDGGEFLEPVVTTDQEQLACNLKSHAVWLARFCMGDDPLAGPCTDNLGVALFVGALWQLGGGAWLVCVAVCSPGKTGYPQQKSHNKQQHKPPMHHHPPATEHRQNLRRPLRQCTAQLVGHPPCKTWPDKLRET